MSVKNYSEKFEGRELSVEIGRLAGQANGSCRVQYGDTVVLVTATMSPEAGSANYFPLNIGYEEKYYAAGKIKGSKWLKREGRPSEDAVLTGRMIDRILRPRFDHNVRNDIQVVPTILSFDGVNDPGILSVFGASLALMISDIPFDGPVAAIRVSRVDGSLVFNPDYEQRKQSDFEIIVAGDGVNINMIEAKSNVISEDDATKAIISAFEKMKKLIDFQNKIAKEVGLEKQTLDVNTPDEDFRKEVVDFLSPKIEGAVYAKNKADYKIGVDSLTHELYEFIDSKYSEDPKLEKKLKDADDIFHEEINKLIHKNILEADRRPDGRKLDEVRGLSSDISLLPQAHGTGLFNRGTTQVLSVLTLGAPGLEQWIETMENDLYKKRFMHHYTFPPYSVGEVGRIGFTNRREIGHGALAEKALEAVIPSKEDFPYTIRLVSEVLSSNGSSSMASVCGSTLALMDGGVPIKSPVAGIAMGLVKRDNKNYKILTDIQGPEDHHGDMDLKVAGTKDGITAIQMDVKVDGINEEILSKSLEQAKLARLKILDVMNKTISKPKENLSPKAPRVVSFKVNPDKIGTIIGPGGKMINEIIDKTGVEIDIDDDGTVFITSDKEQGSKEAIDWVKGLVHEPKEGEIFDGKVVKVVDFGAFVEIMPGKDGLVHVSEMKEERVEKPSDVVKEGDSVKVKVKKVDEYGKISLTMKNVK